MRVQDSGTTASPGTLGFGADAAAMIQRVREAMELHQRSDFAAASRIYQSVLARYPEHPDVTHYLGMAEYKLGNRDRAQQLLERSIALDGRKAIVHVNLGRIFLNDGANETAIEHFRRALALAPQDWEPTHMLGRALLAAGHAYEAAPLLERAARARPQSPDVLIDLAHAYGSCREHSAAANVFRKVLDNDPSNVTALGGLAFSLRAMNRSTEALHCLEKAIALEPREVRWLCELGSLKEDLGAFNEATSLFRQALEERPKYPVAIAHLLASKQGSDDAALVDKALEHLSGSEIAKPVRVQLEFALGRHFDSTREYDLAFAHYAAANEIVAEGRRYRTLSVEAHATRVISVFKRELFESKRAFGNESDRPVFVVGMPRSGTTLTEQILSSHPEVTGAGELGYFNYMAHVLSNDPGEDGDRASYARELDAAALSQCASGYLRQLDEVSPTARRVVDKMPMNFLQLGLIALTFPRARIVHCVRDPLDTCLSCYFENFHEDQRYATKLESLGHYYRQYERLMRHWSDVLPLAMIEIRYEDTVADVEAQARRLIEFCGLPWDPRCLEFHRTERAVSTPSRWQVRQPIYGSSVQRWKRYERFLEPLRSALSRET